MSFTVRIFPFLLVHVLHTNKKIVHNFVKYICLMSAAMNVLYSANVDIVLQSYQDYHNAASSSYAREFKENKRKVDVTMLDWKLADIST